MAANRESSAVNRRRMSPMIAAFLVAGLIIGCGGAGGGGSTPAGGNSTSGASSGGGSGSTTGGTTTGGTTTGGTTGGTTTGGSTGGTTTGGSTGGDTTGGSTGGDTTGGSTGGTDGNASGILVFSVDGDALYKMALDGAPERIPNTDGAFDPQVSPNGLKVVYSVRVFTDELRVSSIDGTGTITIDKGDYDSFAPAFSPDGAWVVFTSNSLLTLHLYKTTADGAGRTKLTNLSAGAAYGKFDPTGNFIVFVTGETGDDIYSMRSDGSSMKVLSASSYDENDPSFSPDGVSIVFCENVGTFDEPRRKLMIMGALGGSRKTLTSNNDDSDPVFSPDGSGIVFSRAVGSGRELFWINRDGSGLRQLTSLGAVAQSPSFATQ